MKNLLILGAALICISCGFSIIDVQEEPLYIETETTTTTYCTGVINESYCAGDSTDWEHRSTYERPMELVLDVYLTDSIVEWNPSPIASYDSYDDWYSANKKSGYVKRPNTGKVLGAIMKFSDGVIFLEYTSEIDTIEVCGETINFRPTNLLQREDSYWLFQDMPTGLEIEEDVITYYVWGTRYAYNIE